MPDLTLCGSGHRPGKLVLGRANAYDPTVYRRLIDLASAALEKYKPARVISGMALGWDQALAEAAIAADIPLYAYVPFRGQESVWSHSSQTLYRLILDQATAVKICYRGGYQLWKLSARNRQMVDDSKLVLALFDGTPKGGTFSCLQYAASRDVPVVNLWKSWLKFGDAFALEEAA